MHHPFIPSLFLVALLSSGCSATCPIGACGPGATLTATPVNPQAVTVAATPAPVPSPAATPRPSTQALPGVVRYFGAALPGATVSARLLGGTAVLARATTAADGTFSLELPAGTAAGTPLALVALAPDGRSVAGLGVAPARSLQAEAELVLDERQTLALAVLAPRLVAAVAIGTPAAVQAAVSAFQAAAAALGSPGFPSQASFQALAGKLLSAASGVLATPEAQAAAAAAVPATAAAALGQQADALAATIRDAVGAGLARPQESLLGPLQIGGQSVTAVFTAGSGGTSGGGGGNPVSPTGPSNQNQVVEVLRGRAVAQ